MTTDCLHQIQRPFGLTLSDSTVAYVNISGCAEDFGNLDDQVLSAIKAKLERGEHSGNVGDLFDWEFQYIEGATIVKDRHLADFEVTLYKAPDLDPVFCNNEAVKYEVYVMTLNRLSDYVYLAPHVLLLPTDFSRWNARKAVESRVQNINLGIDNPKLFFQLGY